MKNIFTLIILVLGVLSMLAIGFLIKNGKLFDYKAVIENLELNRNPQQSEQIKSFREKINGRWVRFRMIEINPSKVELSFISNPQDQFLSVKELAQKGNCQIAINGTYFDLQGKPLGLMIEKGNILNSLHQSNLLTGVFYLDEKNKPNIAEISQYALGNDRFSIQAGPLILKPDGRSEILSDDKTFENRSFIALDKNGQIFLIIVQADLKNNESGISLFETSQVFREGGASWGLNLTTVLNLDGGSSTGLYAFGDYYAEALPVENIICVKDIPTDR